MQLDPKEIAKARARAVKAEAKAAQVAKETRGMKKMSAFFIRPRDRKGWLRQAVGGSKGGCMTEEPRGQEQDVCGICQAAASNNRHMSGCEAQQLCLHIRAVGLLLNNARASCSVNEPCH